MSQGGIHLIVFAVLKYYWLKVCFNSIQNVNTVQSWVFAFYKLKALDSYKDRSFSDP